VKKASCPAAQELELCVQEIPCFGILLACFFIEPRKHMSLRLERSIRGADKRVNVRARIQRRDDETHEMEKQMLWIVIGVIVGIWLIDWAIPRDNRIHAHSSSARHRPDLLRGTERKLIYLKAKTIRLGTGQTKQKIRRQT